MNTLFCKNIITALLSVHSRSNLGLAKNVVPPLFQTSRFMQHRVLYCKHGDVAFSADFCTLKTGRKKKLHVGSLIFCKLEMGELNSWDFRFYVFS